MSESERANAQSRDASDPLRGAKDQFLLGKKPRLYFAGHSLGALPKNTRPEIEALLDDWEKLGVEGHQNAQKPWLPYHELIAPSFARLVGAKESEVVCMNTLTVNLHLLMVSFYRPEKKRFKIICEANPFPSDRYAFASQLRFHGFDEKEGLLELPTTANGLTSDPQEILEFLEKHKNDCALVLLGNPNYLSGQAFDVESIASFCQKEGIAFGLNLAHGVGNLEHELHAWGVDFAVWCTYKYLNAGPGSMAGAFIHEKHHKNRSNPRFEGWWGHNKESRFEMGPDFDPIPTAEAWQLSNPPILSMSAVLSSMKIFDSYGMKAIRERSIALSDYFESLLKERLPGIEVVSPKGQRGAMLCLKLKQTKPSLAAELAKEKIIVDFRYPDIIRATPSPLYTHFEDVWELTDRLAHLGGNW